MIKRIGCFLLCLMLTMAVCACDQEPAPTTEETLDVTVPTLDKSKTPQEMLSSAAEQTRKLEAFCIDYVRIVGEERSALSAQLQKEADSSYTALTLSCGFSPEGVTIDEVDRYYQGKFCYEHRQGEVQRLDSDSSYSLSRILSEMQELKDRSGLMQELGSHPLNVIPSYGGAFRYEVEDLTRENFIALLYGTATKPQEDILPEGDLTVALTVAPEGHLSALEFISGTITVTLTIAPLEEDQKVTPPEWING